MSDKISRSSVLRYLVYSFLIPIGIAVFVVAASTGDPDAYTLNQTIWKQPIAIPFILAGISIAVAGVYGLIATAAYNKVRAGGAPTMRVALFEGVKVFVGALLRVPRLGLLSVLFYPFLLFLLFPLLLVGDRRPAVGAACAGLHVFVPLFLILNAQEYPLVF